MLKKGMRPVHPGEILFEEFMKPSDPPINANRFAKALEAPANRVTAIIKGQRLSRAAPRCVWLLLGGVSLVRIAQLGRTKTGTAGLCLARHPPDLAGCGNTILTR
jgi:hypothetical protein